MSTYYECLDCGERIYQDVDHSCKKPITIPTVPEDAMVPALFLPEEDACLKGSDCVCMQEKEKYVLADEHGAYEGFQVKDSGKRQSFESGMVRDTQDGKVDYTRVLDGPMFHRWAAHVTKAEVKYPDIAPGVPNWTLANGEEEKQRFKKSAFRHMIQWLRGDTDEDHAAAVMFNINGYEYVREKMK